MECERLDEESKGLLRKILVWQAYRQRMIANIRGHGMKFVLDLDAKLLLAEDLEHSLRVMRDVDSLYTRLGGGDIVEAVRIPVARIPYPDSKLELAACMSITDRAERVAASSYVDCVCREYAAIASTLLETDRSATQRGEKLFVEFSSEEGNRPRAQQMFDRWLAIAIRSLGRPGTRGDARAVELSLRSRHNADSVRAFLKELESFRSACGLRMPDGAQLGLELPAGVATG